MTAGPRLRDLRLSKRTSVRRRMVKLRLDPRVQGRVDPSEEADHRIAEGDFSAAYLEGDNSTSLPTDTMRSTAYVIAQDTPLDDIERPKPPREERPPREPRCDTAGATHEVQAAAKAKRGAKSA
jgi:hypothetical protein